MATKSEVSIIEKPPGSGVWWVNWVDASGKKHQDKAGSKDAAQFAQKIGRLIERAHRVKGDH
jgi:hypothetical protein